MSKEKIKDMEREVYRKAYTFNYNILKGELLQSIGNKKEGEKLIDEALKIDVGFTIYYYALNKQQVEGKSDEAYKILTKQVKAMSDNFQNHFAFGEYYLRVGNQKKATEHFKIAYDMTKEQVSRWKNYAEYLYMQNKLALASN